MTPKETQGRKLAVGKLNKQETKTEVGKKIVKTEMRHTLYTRPFLLRLMMLCYEDEGREGGSQSVWEERKERRRKGDRYTSVHFSCSSVWTARHCEAWLMWQRVRCLPIFNTLARRQSAVMTLRKPLKDLYMEQTMEENITKDDVVLHIWFSFLLLLLLLYTSISLLPPHSNRLPHVGRGSCRKWPPKHPHHRRTCLTGIVQGGELE